MIVWWSLAGLIHHSFIKLGEIITVKKYCRKIDEMYQKLSRKQPALVNRKGIIFLQMITRHNLHKLNYKVLDQSPYPPDISTTDFHVFKHLFNLLQEKFFRRPKDVATTFNWIFASRKTTFYVTGIKKTWFSLAKELLKIMVPVLINEVCLVKIYSFFM